MKASKELNNEKELRLRSEALNRMIQKHDEELIEFSEEIEKYKRIAMNLVAVIALLVIVGSYAGYALYTKSNDKVELVTPADKTHAYVLKK